jgi:type 1 fimbria pilin
MKRILLAILGVLVLSTMAFADVTVKSNGANPALGRAEILNFKGCTASISGEVVTFDCSTLANTIWASVHIPAAGINWADVKVLTGSTSGINWTAFGV